MSYLAYLNITNLSLVKMNYVLAAIVLLVATAASEKCRPCMEMAFETEDETIKTMMEAMMGGAAGEDSPFG